jgi:hypothetical protein
VSLKNRIRHQKNLPIETETIAWKLSLYVKNWFVNAAWNALSPTTLQCSETLFSSWCREKTPSTLWGYLHNDKSLFSCKWIFICCKFGTVKLMSAFLSAAKFGTVKKEFVAKFAKIDFFLSPWNWHWRFFVRRNYFDRRYKCRQPPHLFLTLYISTKCENNFGTQRKISKRYFQPWVCAILGWVLFANFLLIIG